MQDEFFSHNYYRGPEVNGQGEVILSVEECHSLVNDAVGRMGRVRIRGELSRPSIVRDSMAFFDLKDVRQKDYVLECALFGFSFRRFRHLMQDGMEIIITGRVNLYKTGRLRIIADVVEPSGEGAWKKALEELKKKLAAKGYFDAERKREIPRFMRNVGLITSEQGQALHDFRRNLGEYGFKVTLFGVWVEGDKAEQSIAQAIRWFNKNRPDMDVLVLIRGGGGFENLKAYNSELIAEEIAASRIPVITGIGHEKDESIADYVADLKCSTPTAVAVYIRTQRERLIQSVEALQEDLFNAGEQLLKEQKRTLIKQGETLSLAFDRQMERYSFFISRMAEIMHHRLGRIFESFHRTEQQFFESGIAFERYLFSLGKRIEVAEATLKSANPEAILQRGYSMVFTKEGTILREASKAKIGEAVIVKLWKGKLGSRVEEIEE